MNTSVLDLFFEVLSDIKYNYPSYEFFIERDIVWTVQKKLSHLVSEKMFPYKIYNDYPIEKGEHRSKSVDLAVVKTDIDYKDILEGRAAAELVVEFKFEPSKKRKDICIHKLPVVFWSNILDDIERISHFTNQNKAKIALAVFIDENSRYKDEEHYKISKLSKWDNWGDYRTNIYNISTLITRFPG